MPQMLITKYVSAMERGLEGEAKRQRMPTHFSTRPSPSSLGDLGGSKIFASPRIQTRFLFICSILKRLQFSPSRTGAYMTTFDYVTNIQYHNWANERLLATAEKIPHDQLMAGEKLSQGTAFETLRHMLDVDW
jgi:hypothetical protein